MSNNKEIDRLVKFAEMMLGQLKSARISAEAVAAVSKALTGAELMTYEQSRIGFERCIRIGEDALAPFRSELTAQEPAHVQHTQGEDRAGGSALRQKQGAIRRHHG